MRDLIDQALLVRPHRLAGFPRQRQVGREHLGIFGDLLVLDVDHRAQPLLEPRRRGASGLGDLLQRRIGAIEPALRHRLAQRSLARKMAIDAAVAHIERTRDVHDGGLGQPVAAQDLLGSFENPLRGQDDPCGADRALVPLLLEEHVGRVLATQRRSSIGMLVHPIADANHRHLGAWDRAAFGEQPPDRDVG